LNFDRIWSLQPEIVKLDRSFAIKAADDPSARRLLPAACCLLPAAADRQPDSPSRFAGFA
jgi:EAL domain-containing protein (putative c-di-GMP-specific phosphodiesterase class I)